MSNEGTYPNKPLIVTSFKMDLAPLANVEKTQLQTGSWRKQYSGMCIDASRNRIIIGNTDSGVFVLDLTTGDVVSQLNNLPEVGHSNDFAYDPEDDLIYVASYTNSNLTNISVIYASTLTFKEYKNLGYPVHTVSYDPDYKLLKTRLMEAARRSEARNPFGAGRPERFDEEDKKNMLEMQKSGMTYRQIAEEYECSTSIVYKAIFQMKYGWK